MRLSNVTTSTLVEARLAMEVSDILCGMSPEAIDLMRQKWLKDLVQYQEVPQRIADETEERLSLIDRAYQKRFAAA